MTGAPPGAALSEQVDEWLRTSWSPDITVRSWWQRLFDAGYAFPTWPAGLGGRAATGEQARSIAERLGAAEVVAPPTGNVAVGLAVPTLLEHGSPEQIHTFVPRIALGLDAWCQLFSEPGAGSDLASVATHAELDGDHWVVTGQKPWSSAAGTCQMGMLLARTERNAPKHAGMTYLLIDMDQPGVEVRPLRQMDGDARFCEVFLTEARVPRDRVLGGIGAGWSVARTTLAAERANTAGRGASGLHAARSGETAGDLDLPVARIVERARRSRRRRIPSGAIPAKAMIELARDHGRADDPVVRQRLAAYWCQTRVDAWTRRRSAAARGAMTGADGPMAKLATSRICQQSRDLSFAIIGPSALLSGVDGPLEGEVVRVGLASPGNRIGGGTDEIQRNVIGERALGLPREPTIGPAR